MKELIEKSGIKIEDFKFYKIIRTVYKGHKHYTIGVVTLTNLEKAIKMQKRWPETSVIIEITTKKNGKIKIRQLKTTDVRTQAHGKNARPRANVSAN